MTFLVNTSSLRGIKAYFSNFVRSSPKLVAPTSSKYVYSLADVLYRNLGTVQVQ